MTKTGRKATAALVAALVMMAAGRASAQDEPSAATDQREATIVLHVANHAALPAHVLDGAKARVTKVYEVIGVHVVWVDSEEPVTPRPDGRLHLAVVLRSLDMAQKNSPDRTMDHVLGLADLRLGRAYIFCDHIATVPGVRTLFPIPLGNVIAHEVGHLLLQANSHSHDGIMRAHVDLHAIHLQNFDQTQARTIRATLMEPTVGATGR